MAGFSLKFLKVGGEIAMLEALSTRPPVTHRRCRHAQSSRAATSSDAVLSLMSYLCLGLCLAGWLLPPL